MEKLTLKDLQDTYQEFEDHAYRESMKPKLSAKAVAIAMRVLHEKIEAGTQTNEGATTTCINTCVGECPVCGGEMVSGYDIDERRPHGDFRVFYGECVECGYVDYF